jgi:hypothetical protein
MSAAVKLKDERPMHKNVHVALAHAQAEMGPVVKGSVNPHFKSKYADLADIFSVVLPALNAHGLALTASIITLEGEKVMRTTISHGESDTHVHCDVPLIVQKQDMQGMKSATTYAKRIGTESLCGIAPEDDDGNAAAKSAPSKATTPNDVYKATDAQKLVLMDLAKKAGIETPESLKELSTLCMNKPMADLKKLVEQYVTE